MQAPSRPFIIGTRGSPLALWQARRVQALLCDAAQAEPDMFPIQILQTSGDQIMGELKDFGGKGLFTRELELALLDGRIDLAVHSMKDVPTVGHEDLMIPAILPRADVRDGFISKRFAKLDDLPDGALVGTASLRRRAQLSSMRPGIEFCLLRGNVGTRLRKLEEGVCDATFLACAGLMRLGQDDAITEAIETARMLPAPAQGAIGIEIRRANEEVRALITPLNHRETELAITAERAFLRALDGSCRTPIAALATLDGDDMSFEGELLALNGSKRFTAQGQETCPTVQSAYDFGFRLGTEVRTAADGQIDFDL